MAKNKAIAAAGMTGALAIGSLIGVTLGNPVVSGAQDSSTTTEAPAADATTDAKPQGQRGKGGHFDLEAAATVLDMTTDELRTALGEGKSLAEVAEAQGVDKQVLIDALVAEGEARLDEAKADLPDRIAEMVDSTLPARGEGGMGKGGRGGPEGRGGAPLESVAEALGMTTDELREALTDDATIADVAEAQGVDIQVVIDAMAAQAQERLDEAVAEGKITQEQADERLAEMTERIAEQVENGRPDRPERGDKPADDAPADDSTTTEGD